MTSAVAPDPALQSAVRARNAVALAFVLNGFAFACLVTRLPDIRGTLELSNSGIGLLLLAASAGSVIALPSSGRLIERFSRTGHDAIQYQVTFNDPATWSRPWTAAVDLKSRPTDSGVFEYACHEGNYGLFHMLSTSRLYDR